MSRYDYLVVGAGLFGATFARLMTDFGKKVLVIDRRQHIGGNCYSEKLHGIDVHLYGPHIFYCNDIRIWNFAHRFTTMLNFKMYQKACRNGRMYSLPLNMNTFQELWGVTTPGEAKDIIEAQKVHCDNPSNLEQKALATVGKDLYEWFVRDYVTKQWQRQPTELPSFLLNKLPLRFTWDDSYYDFKYQGIPDKGYADMFDRMLDGIQVETGVNYLAEKKDFDTKVSRVVYTGQIDEFFGYKYGDLQYRTLDFVNELHYTDNYQGTTVIAYHDLNIPWTRVTEHKHFTKVDTEVTIITKEYTGNWERGKVPYYPINIPENNDLYHKYFLDAKQTNVLFGGRLAEYRYYDMHQVIGSAMKKVKQELGL